MVPRRNLAPGKKIAREGITKRIRCAEFLNERGGNKNKIKKTEDKNNK